MALGSGVSHAGTLKWVNVASGQTLSVGTVCSQTAGKRGCGGEHGPAERERQPVPTEWRVADGRGHGDVCLDAIDCGATTLRELGELGRARALDA